MNHRTIAFATFALVGAIVIGAILYLQVFPSRQLKTASVAPVNASVKTGMLAPNFQMPTTAGPFELWSEKKPVFLEVFATWCPHCQRETSVIDQLYDKYKSSVAFIAIPGSDTAMDNTSPETLEDVLNFQAKFSVRYPIALYDPNLTVANLYIKGGFPTIAIIDKKKTISYYNSGEIAFGDLDAELAKVTR
jgi:thiol-disulfide isomerase/thioredoxin